MKIRNRIALLIVVLFVLGTGTVAAYQSQPKTITLIDGEEVNQYETANVLVGEFLASQGVTLGERDIVEPAISTSIVDGMTIKLQKEKTTTEVKKEVVHYETERRPSDVLKKGETEVMQVGVNGVVEKVYKVTTLNGEVTGKVLIEINTVLETKPEIILEGHKDIIIDPKTGKSYEYTKELQMEATAYTDIPNDRWYGITASGMPTFVGMVAVDKKTIPLGTKLYVEGYGIAHAGDTGGAVKGKIIDLFMNSEKEARAFGRRPRKVYILKDQDINVRAERNAALAQK